MASEELACRALRTRGLAIRARRLRTPYAEIDVLAFDARAGIHVLVEVKTDGGGPWRRGALGGAQAARLRRAREWLQGKLATPVASELAIVLRDGRIEWLPDFL